MERTRKEPQATKPELEQEIDSLEIEDEAPVEEDTVAMEARENDNAEEAKAEKPKRKRAPRRKKAPTASPLTAMFEGASEEKMDEPAVAVAVQAKVEAPKVEIKEEVPAIIPSSDMAVAEASIQKTMEGMVKQWASVKEISSGVSTNFEQLASRLSQLQMDYAATLQEVSKPKYAKVNLLNKIAVGVSAFALTLSVVSISLSQSARQATVDFVATSKAPKIFTANEPIATAPAPARVSTPEVASLPKKDSIVSRKKEVSRPHEWKHLRK